jgi:ribosomal-protein-alanine N-acetyltransferase
VNARWTIEPITPEQDLDIVLEVENESFTNPWTREMYLWELQNSDVSHVFVLRTESERVAAFCSFWLVFDELHINNLAVRPKCRGQGMATALLNNVLEHGERVGARRATLEVRRSNEPARRLYEGLGFEVAGIRPGYYTNPTEDALILWRKPPGPVDDTE